MSARTHNRLAWVNLLSALLTLVVATAMATMSMTLLIADSSAQPRTYGERLAVTENRIQGLSETDQKLFDDLSTLRTDAKALTSRVDSLDQRMAMVQGGFGSLAVIVTLLQLIQMTTGRHVRRGHDSG